jgi:hypothetical protein
MAENKKTSTFLQASTRTLSNGAPATATSLAPGERVSFNEDDASAQGRARDRSRRATRLRALRWSRSTSRPRPQEEEKQELLAKAEKIAAEQRQEGAGRSPSASRSRPRLRARGARSEGQPAVTAETDFPPQDEEAQRSPISPALASARPRRPTSSRSREASPDDGGRAAARTRTDACRTTPTGRRRRWGARGHGHDGRGRRDQGRRAPRRLRRHRVLGPRAQLRSRLARRRNRWHAQEVSRPLSAL